MVGVDLDETLIEVARRDWPQADWQVQNLAGLSLADESGNPAEFDLVVSAGNVLTFLSVDERLPALTQLRQHLATDGRIVVGFGAGRGYGFDEFEADADQAGLVLEQRYSTWTLRPPAADFLVAVLAVRPH